MKAICPIRIVSLFVVLALLSIACKSQSRTPEESPLVTFGSTSEESASGEAAESALQTGRGCRFLSKDQVEAIMDSRLTMEATSPTGCRFDPVDESARGAVYSVDPYDEDVYVSLTTDGEPVDGLGEKAAAVEVKPGAQVLIKKGNLLVIVTVGGTGSGGFAAARDKAIRLSEVLLPRI